MREVLLNFEDYMFFQDEFKPKPEFQDFICPVKSTLDWKNEGRSSKASERASDWAADFKKVIQSYFANKIWKYILWAVRLKIYILNLKIYLNFKD